MASGEYVYTLGKAFRFGRYVGVLHQIPKFNVDLAINHLREDIEVVEIDRFEVSWMNQSTTLLPFKATNLIGLWDPRHTK